jgi:hypothetical protein
LVPAELPGGDPISFYLNILPPDWLEKKQGQEVLPGFVAWYMCVPPLLFVCESTGGLDSECFGISSSYFLN